MGNNEAALLRLGCRSRVKPNRKISLRQPRGPARPGTEDLNRDPMYLGPLGAVLGIWLGLWLTTPAMPLPMGLPFAVAGPGFEYAGASCT
jgi:hypothetical protein